MDDTLPEGWAKHFSKTQKRWYYYHAGTNETTWEKPTGPAAPPRKRPREEAKVVSVKPGEAVPEGTLHGSSPAGQTGASSTMKTAPPLAAPVVQARHPFSNEDKWTREDLQVNKYLQGVYKLGKIEDSSGSIIEFKDCVNPFEGKHLFNLVNDNNYRNVLEVGCAMGASAVWICEALKRNGGGKLVSIDPNQSTTYNHIGRLNVQRSGLSDYHEVIEMTSYLAMPLLLQEVLAGKREKFDMVFIDGWHTFDYTLIDFFYADLLTRVNGLIVVDDIRHTSVKSFYEYVNTNYEHCALIAATPVSETMATYQKKGDDSRTWNYHKSWNV
ncbi:unnamed protein product [Chrysoparadoxa australica]